MSIFGRLFGNANTTRLSAEERRKVFVDFVETQKELRRQFIANLVNDNLGPGRDLYQRAATSFVKLGESGDLDKAEKAADKAALSAVAKRHHISKSGVSSIVAEFGSNG